MAKRLYIGGLPYSTTEDELRALFAEVGSVTSVKIITDKFTGRSRGFGFVEFANDADGDAAIERFHDSEFGGRKLTVNEARPMEERAPRRERPMGDM
ncbi:RNA-binding protein [Candidatus Peregrinibacteria bacterium CG11_big_fil_rev_8_21_14_0_20_46_8]|nr:MAG: RNA-binding protein [Candidatus Peregrinibacteria bacterium CG11_big_fil_rev_8_21_14_0_20_46_8]